MKRYTGKQAREYEALTDALHRLEEKEINLWRAFTEHGMRAQVYGKLSQEYQEERLRIELAVKSIQQENREYIAGLDAALEIEVRYTQ